MRRFQGTPAAPGYGDGPLAVCCITRGGCEKTLDEARQDCLDQIHRLMESKAGQPEESKEILTAYEMLLSDSYLFGPIEKRIADGETLIKAVEEEFEQVALRFDRMENAYMRQRSEDIRAIKAMLLQSVRGERKEILFPSQAEKVILAAEELSPADMMEWNQTKLAGIWLEKGGLTSHTVILAKTMGIPAVVGVKIPEQQEYGIRVLLDGQTGIIVTDPDTSSAEEFLRLQEDYSELLKQAEQAAGKPAITRDGQHVKVCINTGSTSDFENHLDGWDGIGLLRTEFLYTDRKEQPNLEEQRKYFQKAFAFAAGKPITIRTLDIGGDKEVAYLHLPVEENPFLGNRGIRLCLREEEVFRTQLRALLEAANGTPFSLMFPMVSTVDEFCRARQIFEHVKEQVKKGGCPVSEEIRLGIMVETPAAAIMSDEFAGYVDFMSIGTNDLTQYIMAADRGNSAVNYLYDVCQPAVLRMIQRTVYACEEQGVEISVCGEAASDPRCIPLLIAMGIRKLSVSPTQVGMVKYRIGCLDTTKKNCGL